jgi:phosphoesterase RecJ-like protein
MGRFVNEGDVVEQEQKRFLELLKSHKGVTVLSHLRPDGDAIGTSLGVYHILKNAGFRVEIANYSKELPRDFDFLEGFNKIKNKIDFDESLIITCDSGSIDRLEFDLSRRTIVNIDHHKSNTNYGELNIVGAGAVSSSIVAYYFLRDIFETPQASAEAFYTALLSDSRSFTTSSVDKSTFEFASELVELGADPAKIAKMMKSRKSLASIRLLARALESLKLYENGEIAVTKITAEDLSQSGAKEYDREGIVEYGKSLATVKISILLMELDNQIKVSLRSKGVDVSKIAQSFGGGGHKEASGCSIAGSIDEIKDIIIEKIKESGVLN